VFFYSVRLFSTKSFKALGTLIYHKAAVQALAFARTRPVAARLDSLHPHHRGHRGHHYHRRPRDPANSRAGGGGSGLAPGTTCPLRGVRDSGRDLPESGGDDDDGGDGDHVLDYDNQDDDRIIPVGEDDGGGKGEEAREGEEEGGKEGDGEDDDDDEMGTEEKASRSQWLVSGGKDGRVVLWALMDFASEGHQKERVAP